MDDNDVTGGADLVDLHGAVSSGATLAASRGAPVPFAPGGTMNGGTEGASMRALRPLLIVALALAFTHTVAGQSEESLEPVASPSASASPSAPVPIREGVLEAGTYTTTAFDPTLVLTLGDGWHALFQDDLDEVAFEDAGAFLGLTRPATVIDPAPAGAIPAPDDLATWLLQHPSLVATEPTAVEIAGHEGVTFDVGLESGTAQLDIFAYPTGNLHLQPGTLTRLWVVPMEGPDLVILAMAPEADFDEAVVRVGKVVASLLLAP